MADTDATSIARGTNDVQDPTPASSKSSDEGAPAGGQAGDQPDGDQASSQQPPEGQTAANQPEVSDEELTGMLDQELGIAPEETLEQLRRNHAASSKEAKRLKATIDGLQEQLRGQGVEAVFKRDGTLAGLKAIAVGGNGEALTAPAAPTYDSLSATERDLFVQDAQKAIELIWEKSQTSFEKHFAKPGPTVQEVLEPPSPEQKTAVVEKLSKTVARDGDARYPDFEKSLPQIEAMLDKMPDAMKDAYYKQPDVMLGLLHDKVTVAKQRLLNWARKQQTNADGVSARNQQAAGVGPEGQGGVAVGDISGASSKMASAIARSDG